MAVQAQTVKVLPPRPLGQEETFLTLRHWKNAFSNFYRRDDYYRPVLTLQWNPNEDNYGLADETTGLKRKKEVLKDDLVCFINISAAYLPSAYITERLLGDTSCLNDIWDAFDEYYGAEISSDSFLDLAGVQKNSTETYNFLRELLHL